MLENKIDLNDIFWTFQGEGALAGRRALFVRMPHCNLRCSWCDTSFDTVTKYTEQDIRLLAGSEPARFAVVTGGEPALHRHTKKVVSILKDMGFFVAIETNGTAPLPVPFDWVTCSPKRDAQYKVHERLVPHVSEFKYVVDRGFDFSVLDWLNDPAVSKNHRLSLSPEYGEFLENLSMIYDYIQKHPHWNISLQTHKWMGVK